MGTATDQRLLIVIPAHNEAEYLERCLDSFLAQTRKPDLLLIADDSSSDRTPEIVKKYGAKHPWIRLERKKSDPGHTPGAKVVRAFQYGLDRVREPFGFIGKFDADIVLPPDYFERVLKAFGARPKLGMCAGLLYVEKKGKRVYEPIADRSHVRGPLKLYRRDCFQAIGGLRPAIGWDTADVLLARYHGYETLTLPELEVVHLRPTGGAYSATRARLQGEALYHLRYDPGLLLLSSLKMAWKRRQPLMPLRHLQGFLKARRSGPPGLLSAEEGRFARQWRWRQIRSKFGD